MSKRDKNLLIFLSFVIIIAIFYFFIYQTQKGSIESLESQIEIQDQQLQYYEESKKNIKSLTDQKVILTDALIMAFEGYLSQIEQEEIILLLDEILIRANVEVNGLSFSETLGSDFPNVNYDMINVMMNVSGNYEDIVNFMSSFWRFDQNIYISNINMTSSEEGIDFTLVVSFIRMNNEYTKTVDLFEWYNNSNIYENQSPFGLGDFSDIFSPNYYYIGTDVEFYNPPFEGFNDTYGHWAEEVINFFGRNGYVIGDVDKNIYPDDRMTRLETVILLDLVFRWELADDFVALESFGDYAEIASLEDVEKKTLLKAFNSGYLFGFDDNTLRPNDEITYKELGFIGANLLENEAVTWQEVALEIEEKYNYSSLGLQDENLYATKAEIIYFLSYIDNKNQ